jgi:hypothetical protein
MEAQISIFYLKYFPGKLFEHPQPGKLKVYKLNELIHNLKISLLCSVLPERSID